MKLTKLDYQAYTGYVEIQGVGTGAFNPKYWEKNTLNFIPEFRHPMIYPRLRGYARNIYAPSALQIGDGWRLFYGAWDGVDTSNDRIYSVTTKDFLNFDNHEIVIEHGDFVHVCNVNAITMADGSYYIAGTAYPDKFGRNKPIAFFSPDGKTWNGSPAPYSAKFDDIVQIGGYQNYIDADNNGTNTLLREGDVIHLYFTNWRDAGKVYRASGTDGKTYNFEGVSLNSHHAANDVKKFIIDDKSWYLMGLHANTDRLWYSLSNDGMNFASEYELLRNKDNYDKFIVSLGWVVDNDCLLGVLYGAGDFS